MQTCRKMVRPLSAGSASGANDHLCTKPHYKDGWCKVHHPTDSKARRRATKDEMAARAFSQIAYVEAYATKKIKQFSNNIVLLWEFDGRTILRVSNATVLPAVGHTVCLIESPDGYSFEVTHITWDFTMRYPKVTAYLKRIEE